MLRNDLRDSGVRERTGPMLAASRPTEGLACEFSARWVADLEMINDRLVAAGSARRIDLPSGDPRDRDRISTQLFNALRETRDRRIFDVLYRINSAVIVALCRNRLRHRGSGIDPQDVMEDTFLALWLKLDNFQERPDATFTGWAAVIAERLIARTIRMRRREQVRLGLVSLGRIASTAPHADHVAEQADDRERLAADWSLLVAFAAAGLERLPQRWRTVLHMRDIEGFTYEAIASRVAGSRGAVAMILRRGRRRVLESMRRSLAMGALSGGKP